MTLGRLAASAGARSQAPTEAFGGPGMLPLLLSNRPGETKVSGWKDTFVTTQLGLRRRLRSATDASISGSSLSIEFALDGAERMSWRTTGCDLRLGPPAR